MIPKTVEVPTMQCPVCLERVILTVSQVGYINWKKGELIQRALPELSIDDRERLITGLHGKCWKEFLGPEDEDEIGEELQMPEPCPFCQDITDMSNLAECAACGGTGMKNLDMDSSDNPEPKVIIPHKDIE